MTGKDIMQVQGTEGAMKEIMREFMESLLEGDTGRWAELFHEEAVFEFPYAPASMIQRLDGKAAIQDYIRHFPELLVIHEFTEPVFYPSSDPDRGVVEFGCRGESVQTGKSYVQSYISVIELKDGRIIHYKDYWNPLAALEALEGGEA